MRPLPPWSSQYPAGLDFLPNGGSRKENDNRKSNTLFGPDKALFSYGFTSQAYYMVNGGMRDHYCTNGFSVRPVSDFVTVGETAISGISGTGLVSASY